jgi:stage III sporulation protein AH
MIVIKGKNIVVTSLVLLLCVLVYTNYRLNQDAPGVGVSKPTSKTEQEQEVDLDTDNQKIEDAVAANAKSLATFIVDASMDRESKRSDSIKLLDEIITSKGASEEDKTRASQLKMKIAEIMNTESNVETQLKANGYNSVALIGENNITILVGTDKRLEDKDLAIIKNIVVSETSFSSNNIRIKDNIVVNTNK